MPPRLGCRAPPLLPPPAPSPPSRPRPVRGLLLLLALVAAGLGLFPPASAGARQAWQYLRPQSTPSAVARQKQWTASLQGPGSLVRHAFPPGSDITASEWGGEGAWPTSGSNPRGSQPGNAPANPWRPAGQSQPVAINTGLPAEGWGAPAEGAGAGHSSQSAWDAGWAGITAAAVGTALVAGAAVGERRDASSGPASAPDRTLYLAQCPHNVTEEVVRNHFRELGPEAIVQVTWNMRGGIFDGSGYVEFRTPEKALEASMYAPIPVGPVSCLHRLLTKLHTDVGDADMAVRDARVVFHGGCPDSITDDHLYRHYSVLGEDAISSVRWSLKDGRFRGTGFVEFKTIDLARRALELPPLIVDGKAVTRERNGAGGKVGLPLRKARERASQLLTNIHQAPRFSFSQSQPAWWSAEWLAQNPFPRDFSPTLQYFERDPQAYQTFFREFNLSVEPATIWPVLDLHEVDFGGFINAFLMESFSKPTPLQSVSWPAMLSGRDLIAVAPAGSGKTLAYGLPCLTHIMAQRRSEEGEGPIAVILAPSREHVLQIHRDLERFQTVLGVQIGAAFGGDDPAASRFMQATKLVSGCEVLVATPGRLLDFVESGVTPLARTTLLVVDEAPQLLARTLQPQVDAVLKQLRPDRQVAFFGASLSLPEQQFVESVAPDPVKVVLGKATYPPVNAGVTQRILFPEGDRGDREDMLVDVMKEVIDFNPDDSRMLIYVLRKDYLRGIVRGLRYIFSPRVLSLAEGATQLDRVTALASLNTNPVGMLVATDVVSRHWEIEELAYVINFEMPPDIATYIDRINHLGVDGKPGMAISFFTAKDEPLAGDLVRVLQQSGQAVPPRLLDLAARAADPIGGLGTAAGWGPAKAPLPPLTEREARLKEENKTQLIEMRRREAVRAMLWPEAAAERRAVAAAAAAADAPFEPYSPGQPLAGYEGTEFDGGRLWSSDY